MILKSLLVLHHERVNNCVVPYCSSLGTVNDLTCASILPHYAKVQVYVMHNTITNGGVQTFLEEIKQINISHCLAFHNSRPDLIQKPDCYCSFCSKILELHINVWYNFDLFCLLMHISHQLHSDNLSKDVIEHSSQLHIIIVLTSDTQRNHYLTILIP